MFLAVSFDNYSLLYISFSVLHLSLLINSHLFNLTFFFFAGKPSFSKKQADLFFPPDFADDFPVAMQVIRLLNFVVLATCMIDG